MRKLLKLFKKREYKMYSFHTGTNGFRKHAEFLKYASDNNIRIVNSFILYGDYSSSHKPKSINYVVEL